MNCGVILTLYNWLNKFSCFLFLNLWHLLLILLIGMALVIKSNIKMLFYL